MTEDLANRLRLAHQSRRAKEHQLDDIRRALCDTGIIQDNDPYSHADLADVIRQAWADTTPPAEEPPVQCWHTEAGTPCDWDVCKQPERLTVGDYGTDPKEQHSA